MINGPGDHGAPSLLHPAFHGSFDWHSCVHGFWTLATVLRLHPQIPEAPAIRALFDDAAHGVEFFGETAETGRRVLAEIGQARGGERVVLFLRLMYSWMPL